jgi:hypothetical protein
VLETGAKEPFQAPWVLQVIEITNAKVPRPDFERSQRRVPREYEGYSASTQSALKSYSLRARARPPNRQNAAPFGVVRDLQRPLRNPHQEARLSPSPEDTDSEASAKELSPPPGPPTPATKRFGMSDALAALFFGGAALLVVGGVASAVVVSKRPRPTVPTAEVGRCECAGLAEGSGGTSRSDSGVCGVRRGNGQVRGERPRGGARRMGSRKASTNQAI